MAVIFFQRNRGFSYHTTTKRYDRFDPRIQNRLFIKRSHSALNVIAALVLSLLLMIADVRYQSLTSVRYGLSLLTSPLQYGIDYPVRFMEWMRALIGSKKALLDENQQLRHQQIILKSELQTLTTLQRENIQLKKILSMAQTTKQPVLVAQVLMVETSHTRQSIILNRGIRDGVFNGQPVLDVHGVIGQIIDVGLMTSTVLLISDSKSAVPVQNERTGEHAILIGTNNNETLSLIHVPSTSSIMKGDRLVTSGFGRRYPEGYPVGQVVEVKHIPGDNFITVRVKPIALLSRNRLVVLMWPAQEHNELTAQINARMNKLEGNI